MKNIVQQIKIIVLGMAVAFGLSYAFAWTGPIAAPPDGNVPAPINVGSDVQTKLGSLILNAASPVQNVTGLTVFGTTLLNGHLTLADGSQGAGKVLVSDANGNASWVPVSSLGIGVTKIVAGQNITVSPTSGTGVVTINGSSGGSSSSGGGGTSSTIEGGYTTDTTYAKSGYTGVTTCSSHWGKVAQVQNSCTCPSGDTTIHTGGSPATYTSDGTDTYECQTQ